MLSARSHVAYDDAKDQKAVVRTMLIAERVAIEHLVQLIALVAGKGNTSRRLLDIILGDEM